MLIPSRNPYDWLGHGIYFWEGDPIRADEWCHRPHSHIREPFVVGAIIDPGYCLSLMQREHLILVESAYSDLKYLVEDSGGRMPENSGGMDRFKRHLDCAVLQMLHSRREANDLRSFDTVRGLFQEGAEPYPNAGFRMKNHIQICVRNPECIKGYFRPIKEQEL